MVKINFNTDVINNFWAHIHAMYLYLSQLYGYVFEQKIIWDLNLKSFINSLKLGKM